MSEPGTRTVWMYWNRGLEEAPELVRICVESWRRRNPNWDVIVLDDRVLACYVDMSDIRSRNPKLTIQAFSDALRWRLLGEYGGIWADATLYCCKPLDEWLDDAMSTEGFFAFLTNETQLYFSWFLAGGPGSTVVREMNFELSRFLLEFGGFRNYWELRGVWRVFHFLETRLGQKNYEFWRSSVVRRTLKVAPYFFQNYLMGAVLTRSVEARRDFQSIATIFGEAPHAIQALTAAEEPPDAEKIVRLLKGPCPVQKLTNKRYVEKWRVGGLLQILAEQSMEESR